MKTPEAPKRPRGRPRVDSTAVLVRLPPDMLADLDAYRGQQGRPEAIRAILHGALTPERRKRERRDRGPVK